LNTVAFDPSGALLGIASTDKTATVWDVTTGVPVATLAGHGSSVTAVAFSPASTRGRTEAATGSLDGIARTWDAATGRPGVALAGPDLGSRHRGVPRHAGRACRDGGGRGVLAVRGSAGHRLRGRDRPDVGCRDRGAPGHAGGA